ncbi:hypothetical protein B0H13DRAFT_1861722 [Mycena leptocephala]|nr:hypothetical protein B0H13DRAFT_1861722 [Mycena leptocephala]
MKLGPKLNAKIISIYWWTNWDRGPSVHEQDGQTGSTDVPWGFELKSPAKWAAVNCPILPRRVLAIKLSNGSSSGFSVMNLHTLHEGTVNVDKDGNWTLLNNFELGDAIANDEREGDKDQMGVGCEDETQYSAWVSRLTIIQSGGDLYVYGTSSDLKVHTAALTPLPDTSLTYGASKLAARTQAPKYRRLLRTNVEPNERKKKNESVHGGKRPQYATQEGTPVKSKLHRPALGRDEDDGRGGRKA